MTIQDWGAIGEIVGALAVVFTIFYLARQIRENSRQVRISSITSINQLINEGFDPIYANKEYLDIWFRGLESRASLDPMERNLFDLFMARLMNNFSTTYTQFKSGTLDQRDFERYVGVYRGIAETRGGQEWLEEIGNGILGEEASTALTSSRQLPLTS